MRIEWFEKRLVFSVSRGLFLVVASVATLASIAALATLAYALTPTAKGPEPPPAKVAPIGEIAANQVLAQIAPPTREARADEEPPVHIEGIAPEPPPDPVEKRIEDLHAAAFPGDGYPWNDETRTTCAYWNSWMRRCERWSSEVTRRGVAGALRRVRKWPDRRAAIAALDNLYKILGAVPADQRVAAVSAFVDLWIDRQSEHARAVAAEDSRVEEQYAAREHRYALATAEKHAYRQEALYALGVGIVTISLAGLLLALLAVERNTRAVRDLVDATRKAA